jgi:hypothetical protein
MCAKEEEEEEEEEEEVYLLVDCVDCTFTFLVICPVSVMSA